jgi:hypothetical protein
MTQRAVNTMAVYETEQGYADTWGIGGDRFPFLPRSMFSPSPFVGTTSPTPIALLSIPPTYGNLSQAQATYGSPSSNSAAAAPWSPSASPLPWIIVGLLVGLYGIHKLYYDKRRR